MFPHFFRHTLSLSHLGPLQTIHRTLNSLLYLTMQLYAVAFKTLFTST